MKKNSILTAIIVAVAMVAPAFAQSTTQSPSGLVESFEQLVALLKKDSVNHKVKPESNMVMIPVEKGPIDGVLLISWDQNKRVASFIQPMTIEVPKETLSELETAIVRMNHALPVPGLGFNHGENAAYFRIALPFQAPGGLPPVSIRGAFTRTLAEAAHLQRTLEGIVNGETKASEIVAFHNQLNVGIDRFPTGSYQIELGGSTWAMTLSSDKSVALLRDGNEVVQSSFKSRGNRIVLQDTGGPMAVKGGGVYRWNAGDGGIQFEREQDASDDRARLLTSGVWKKQ